MEGKTVRNNTITLITHINSHCHNQPMRTKMTEQAHTQQADQWEGGREGGREVGKNKKAVLTCSHWVRYCHSDKSHYDSPFLLTCGGGRNRAVSLKTKGCSRQQSLQEKHHGTLFKQCFWGGVNGGNLMLSCCPCRSFCGRRAVIYRWPDERLNTHARLGPL